MGFTIKQVAEKTNLKTHVLRYYEKEGLLPQIDRSPSGIRRYDDDDLEWLGLIRCLKNTGMSIKQIRKFMDLNAQGDHTLKERCDLLKEHRRIVEERILEMHRHLEEVTCKIERFTEQYEKHLTDVSGK
jgi:DNA-binding transcriptional MerR regulator